jgi:3-oxoacyl-[acyl-carrier protein] reductase
MSENVIGAASAGRPLRGRVALVTGGSRGLGRELCRMLAANGADVAFTYRKRAEEAAHTLQLVENAGTRGLAALSSVESPDDNERVVADVTDALGPIDILINNAGIVSRGSLVADTAPDEFRRLMDVHAFGPARLSQLVIPAMREKRRGDIVMISSVATVEFEPHAAPYTMAKCAQEALAFTLAGEERGAGIRVNVVAPGLIDTDMGRRLLEARPDAFGGESSTAVQVAGVVQDVLCGSDVTGWRFAIASGRVTSARTALPTVQA